MELPEKLRDLELTELTCKDCNHAKSAVEEGEMYCAFYQMFVREQEKACKKVDFKTKGPKS